MGVLGCRRLAIVDRDNGAQPMTNENGCIAVVFNGEIYNHEELREELIEEGHRFRSRCDTEILVHGYEQWGVELLSRLRGMYAFVITDQSRNRVIAARDPFGIKPLYYGSIDHGLVLASEIKPMLLAGCRQPNAVPPGGWIENGELLKRSVLPHASPVRPSENDAKRQLRALLRKSVRARLDTDLEIAVLCSGGIDSSAILYEAVHARANVVAYCIGTSTDAPDACAAERLCLALGVPYRFVRADRQSLLSSIPTVVSTLESFEPNHIRGGALSYALARAVHEDGIKVALCGEGADELLAGYPEFAEEIGDERGEGALDRLVWRFTEELHRTQLQRVDRANMAFAVEVRVPYLDLDLASLALSLPGDFKLRRHSRGSVVGKWILREAYRGILPEEVVDRRKIVISEGAGVGDNSLRGPFFEHGCRQVDARELKALQDDYPAFSLQSREEAYYFKLFRERFGALELATARPRVNVLPTS